MSSRRRRLQRRSRLGAAGIAVRVFLVLITVTVSIIGLGGAVAFALVSSWLKDLPDLTNPKAFEVAQSTKIYSADGKLLANLFLENREVVPLDKISTSLRQAVVAVEDERFYEHKGVDLVGISRAIVKDVMSGSMEEGASTITQQYIRNTILSEERTDITFERKVREAYLAQELEKRISKDKILELYMNTVYYGESAYGAETAAKTYFKKHAKDLELHEAALLAGLPQSPSRLSPYDNPEGAKARRNWVLRKMHENGFITAEEYQKASKAKLGVKKVNQPAQGIYRAHYFVNYVKRQLQERYSTATVFKGGLKVYTTLDTRLQEMAERAAANQLSQPGDPEYAVVSIEPKTGHIKAMVGGKDYRHNKFNYAAQARRQPGSSFKTYVLVAALEKGIPPHRTIDSGSPAYIKVKGFAPWTPSNSEGHGSGMMTIAKATANSVNTVFARLGAEVGPKNVAKTAKKMGITTKLDPYPSISLGVANVTPLEMASAYGTLAANGVYHKPEPITKIVNSDGKTIYKDKKAGKRVLSEEVAGTATQVLRGVITNGTGTRANIGRPAAGKTGTSQNYRDAWFVGYTPQLVTSVWVGYRVERPMYSVHGMRGFGGTLAAPIWKEYMSAALAGKPVEQFPRVGKPAYKWKSGWTSGSDSKKRDDDDEPTPDHDQPGVVQPPAGGGTDSGGGQGNNGGNNNGGGTDGGGTGNNGGTHNGGGGGGDPGNGNGNGTGDGGGEDDGGNAGTNTTSP